MATWGAKVLEGHYICIFLRGSGKNMDLKPPGRLAQRHQILFSHRFLMLSCFVCPKLSSSVVFVFIHC